MSEFDEICDETCEADEPADLSVEIESLREMKALLQQVWVPLDQTIGCSICGWIWPTDDNTAKSHPEACPVGFLQRRAEAAEEQVQVLRKTLEWYGEQTRLCRLIHSEGDSGRNALAADGGQRAAAALTLISRKAEKDANEQTS